MTENKRIDENLFPARAGMNRVDAAVSAFEGAVPRTSGDEPAAEIVAAIVGLVTKFTAAQAA